MKRILKWVGIVVAILVVGGFGAFLYLIPPFYITPAEDLIKGAVVITPLDGISDPKVKLLAERGRDIVVRTGCNGCHAPIGPQGPDFAKFLAGGSYKTLQQNGTYISRNLTPDPETGLKRRSDEEVLRVLRSGVFPDGHVSPMSTMPWPVFSNWTEEDRYAVLVYLRNIPAISHKIPEPVLTPNDLGPGVVQRDVAYHDDEK